MTRPAVRLRFDPGISSDVRTAAVDAASVVSPGMVRLTIVFDDERWGSLKGAIWTNVIEIVAGRRRRLIQVTNRDGKVMVKDGVIISSGKPAPALEKCDGPDA